MDSLWIDISLRHQGWGTKLMQEAEKIGRERGASFVTLNTMNWEALLNVMVQIVPTSIVAKNVSFFKTGPNLASSEDSE